MSRFRSWRLTAVSDTFLLLLPTASDVALRTLTNWQCGFQRDELTLGSKRPFAILRSCSGN